MLLKGRLNGVTVKEVMERNRNLTFRIEVERYQEIRARDSVVRDVVRAATDGRATPARNHRMEAEETKAGK